jgi:DNA-binding transcriptional regulator YbjK
MEFLLAMREDMKATQAKADARHEEVRSNQANTDATLQVMQEKAEIGRKELLARLESDRQTERKELKEMMEGMMHANQTKTDAKLEDLTERIEKTQIKLHTAEMCHDATTKKFQEDLTKTYNKICKRIE